jgi:hypothetical protein
MALYNTTNIKDLPQLEEVVNGDFLIVENEIGTHIVNFENFILGPENVSFYSQIANLSSNLISLSSTVDSELQTLSTYILSTTNTKFDILSTQANTKFNFLSTDYNTKFNQITSTYPDFFYTYLETPLIIQSGQTIGSGNFTSPINTINQSDINIVATNASAATASYFVNLSYATNPIYPTDPNPFLYTVSLFSSQIISSGDAEFEVKITKFYIA